jgi:hypothetical protein
MTLRSLAHPSAEPVTELLLCDPGPVGGPLEVGRAGRRRLGTSISVFVRSQADRSQVPGFVPGRTAACRRA